MHALGCIPDRHDPRDLRFSAVANDCGVLELPPSVDLRPLCSPIRDQGNLGSCTSFAIVSGFRECLLVQMHDFTELSPLYLYFWERSLERTIDQDAGAMIRDGMRVLRKLGAPPEIDWPYVIPQFTQRPSPQAMADAGRYRIAHYHRIHSTIEIKQALVLNQPVVIGIAIFESFESAEVARTGIVPIPDQDRERFLGGHATVIVGYRDQDAVFIVRNSWGSTWGMDGYFTLSYGFFRPHLRLVTDAWTGSA